MNYIHYTQEDITHLDRIHRLKLINSATGIKPANLIGTTDDNGNTNLAVFSSVVHLGSNPPLLGFIARPQTKDVGHTLQNITKSGSYSINHVHPEFTEQAHYTSAKFEKSDSEFDRCGLTPEYLAGFEAPFVQESQLKIGLNLREIIPIPLNGTTLVIGEIVHLIIPETAHDEGDLDLELSRSVGISGLNSYYTLKKIASYPYVRLSEIPKFGQ
ncbi:MAG: flavin reductase [Bacteroidota bacterium]